MHPSIEEDSQERFQSGPIEKFNFNDIKNGIIDFVYKIHPQADLIRDFNGNFIFLLPVTKKFSPSKVYMDLEKNKDRLQIQDWGLSQSSLEDVFTKICEQNGDNNA